MTLEIILRKSSLAQKSISFMAPSIWNKLINERKYLHPAVSFTHNHKKLLFKKLERVEHNFSHYFSQYYHYQNIYYFYYCYYYYYFLSITIFFIITIIIAIIIVSIVIIIIVIIITIIIVTISIIKVSRGTLTKIRA